MPMKNPLVKWGLDFFFPVFISSFGLPARICSSSDRVNTLQLPSATINETVSMRAPFPLPLPLLVPCPFPFPLPLLLPFPLPFAFFFFWTPRYNMRCIYISNLTITTDFWSRTMFPTQTRTCRHFFFSHRKSISSSPYNQICNFVNNYWIPAIQQFSLEKHYRWKITRAIELRSLIHHGYRVVLPFL